MMWKEHRRFSGFWALLLAACLLLSMCGISAAEEEYDYPQDTEKDYEWAIQRLYGLGLIKEEEMADFDPSGVPILEEAVILAVRIAGKEQEALAGTLDQPYEGVTEKGVPYVAYAESRGWLEQPISEWYGLGNSEPPFGDKNDHVLAAQCLDLALEALGYQVNEDFQEGYPWFKAAELGLVRKYQYRQSWEPDFIFTRGNMAVIMANTLRYRMKGTDRTLLQNLLDAGLVPGKGTVRVTSAPSGADILVDGEFSGRTAPCTLILPEGEHDIELKIPGYVSQAERVTIHSGEEPSVEKRLVPDLPEATVITVNTEGDPDNENDDLLRDVTLDTLPDRLSLRVALAAVEKDQSDRMYRIEFAENVHQVVLDLHNSVVSRGNLIINGDRDMDGTPDMTLGATYWGIQFVPGKNIYINGLVLEGNQPVQMTPDNEAPGDFDYENIYILGCAYKANEYSGEERLISSFTPCRTYNAVGSVNYRNINVCGCDIRNFYLFFSYCGNTDNSVTDGFNCCANTLEPTGNLTLQTADCNTWYIYGGDTEMGNGGTPGLFRCCEDNVIRNVLISGNTGSGMTIAAGTGGNSRNTLENVTVRNNVMCNGIHIRTSQLFDEGNAGNTLETSNNTIQDIRFIDNVINNQVLDNCTFWVNVVAGDWEYDPSSTIIAKDNVIRNISFTGNRYFWGERETGTQWIGEEVEYTLESGEVIADMHITNSDGAPYISENNRFENIFFTENWVTSEPYDPYVPYE